MTMHSWSLACAFFAASLCCESATADHGDKQPNAAKPPLYEGLGAIEHKVTTRSPEAQQYFNQGLRLIFAFNHDEAVRAFRAAEALDPDCAMAQWGIALALGPNYNLPADLERTALGYQALVKAQKLAPRATPQEQAYIAAVGKRYSTDPKAERAALDRAYAEAMRAVAARYPDDLDAAVFAAEGLMQLRPWDLWTVDGATPLPGTTEIVELLQRVLEKDPNHTGANHYLIHAVEASDHPEVALPSAKRLAGLAPGAGHLVHMPSHIFYRLGMYDEAARSNKLAIEVDERYIDSAKPEGAYAMMYYPHNITFLAAALMMQGRSKDAIAAAEKASAKLPQEMIKEMPEIEIFVPMPWHVLTRFEKWDDVLAIERPLEDLRFATGMWHYCRGQALVAKGDADGAAREQQGLTKQLAGVPQDLIFMRHSAVRLLSIAQQDLAAAQAARAGKLDDAIAHLRVAVDLQDHESLGRALLAANKPAEAEAVFREDLRRIPNSGWALFGLEKSLRAQDRTTAADETKRRFAKAWEQADIAPR
jgi:tetratricopeptide (TPR) repeat protein